MGDRKKRKKELNKSSKIYIAGHNGMVGSSIWRLLESKGYHNLIGYSSKVLDLRNQEKVSQFFDKEKPTYVFLAAAKVGGIYANNNFRANFIYDNLQIQNNIIHYSYLSNVKKLLFLGSSCIYPKYSIQPIPESALLQGGLEETNEPYAIAKIAGLKMCESYFSQYGCDFISLMPTNLYGPNDNYHPKNSHVLPALIYKFHYAKINNISKVVVWGSGKAKREFLHVDDLAQACFFFMNQLKAEDLFENNISHLNIGSNVEVSIKELSFLIKKVVGFKGDIDFDITKPDGTPRKLLSSQEAIVRGWKPKRNLEKGIIETYKEYKSKYEIY